MLFDENFREKECLDHKMLGDLAMEIGEYDKAIRHYKKQLKIMSETDYDSDEVFDLDSIEGKIANLQNRVQEFWATAINSDSLKVGIDFLTNIVELGTNFVDIIGTLPTILGTISSLGISKLGEGSLD